MIKTNTTSTTATAPAWVAYYRVSTKRQGLGLDAQRERVQAAAMEAGATIVAEVEEKESGKECDRPGLNKAMAEAKHRNATLVVAKADRLSRDLGFAANVVFHSGIEIKALNLPSEAMNNEIVFGVFFGLAAHEARLISERTKAALQALKAKGVQLGRPDAATSITPEMTARSVEVRVRKANENPANIAASNEIKKYLEEGNKRNLSAIARHLNEMGLYTSRGVFHDAKSVKLLCQRYGI